MVTSFMVTITLWLNIQEHLNAFPPMVYSRYGLSRDLSPTLLNFSLKPYKLVWRWKTRRPHGQSLPPKQSE